MSTPARAVVLPTTDDPLEIQELTIPDPTADQVVVKQFASGICHSQLHQMHNPRNAPTLLGHESTGVVIQRGANVTHVDEGDVVLVTWIPRNAPHDGVFPQNASLHVAQGEAAPQNVFTWADHTIADHRYVVKAPPDISREVTAIIGCAVMTGAGAVINTANVQEGESVAIFGVGGVGLSAVTGARCEGLIPSLQSTWMTKSLNLQYDSVRRTVSMRLK